MSVIHDRIKERRLALGMTLATLAELTGVKEATAQRWESGNIKTIKYDTIEKLAEILHCTPQYLMGWETEKEPVPDSGNELRNMVSEMLRTLTPSEIEKVIAFAEGLKASRKE